MIMIQIIEKTIIRNIIQIINMIRLIGQGGMGKKMFGLGMTRRKLLVESEIELLK